jgi:hypothetical protein
VPIILRLMLGLALASLTGVAQAQVLYVSPAGSGDGRTARSPLPFAALKAALLLRPPTTVYVMPGRYVLSEPIRLQGAQRGVTLRALNPGSAVLDGQGKVPQAVIATGSGIVIRDLVITNFTDDGIRLWQTRSAQILSNRITVISSSTWSRGAIHGGNNSPGTLVSRNVIEHTGFAGIIFDTTADGDLSNIVISKNSVTDTCRVQRDCGAIYINGRSRRSLGAIIEGNEVENFGPVGNETKGIYLDDWMSGAIVRRNRILGQGTYAFQIHGGSDNIITNNKVDVLGKFILYQNNDSRGIRAMSGNIFRGNIANTLSTKVIGRNTVQPLLSGNLLK